MLNQCWFQAGPESTTLDQHETSVGSMYRAQVGRVCNKLHGSLMADLKPGRGLSFHCERHEILTLAGTSNN